MVVTNRTESSDEPFDRPDRLQDYVAFSEEAPRFYDETFWEEYNIIKPEDDILRALSKIIRRNR
jgi:hypothetical protein